MGRMSTRRLTNVKVLTGMGRPLLYRFFGTFETELKEKGVVLPSTELPHHEYFESLTDAFFSLDQMPKQMIERKGPSEGSVL